MLSRKTVPFSVRVPYEDAEFIAGLDVNGAKSPSDKLRAIITQARLRERGEQDYSTVLSFFDEQVAPVAQSIRKGELECNKHSELLALVYERVPELLAFLVSYPAEKEFFDLAELEGLERGIANRVFRLLEGVMRLAVSPSSTPCYDPDVLSDRIDPLIDLAQIILSSRDRQKESAR